MAPPAKKAAVKKPVTPKGESSPADSLAAAGINLEADAQSATPEDLKAIASMADRVAELDIQIAEEQEYLKGLTDEKARLENVLLPEAMQGCGMQNFKTTNGAAVEIKSFIQVNLPAAGAIEKATGDEKDALKLRLEEGIKWIEENDGASIIKSNIIINFEKGQNDEKKKVLEQLQKDGRMAIAEETVHPQTLGAFMREKMSKGVTIPAETFKLYTGNKAVVSLPVKKK